MAATATAFGGSGDDYYDEDVDRRMPCVLYTSHKQLVHQSDLDILPIHLKLYKYEMVA